MTRWARLTAAGAVTVGTLVTIRLASYVSYTAQPDVGAIVRLAWRARGERVNECRRLTPTEIAKLPAHMRQEEVCKGRLLPYRLAVTVDDTVVVDRLVHGAGAREDRPLYVFEEVAVEPGPHRVSVQFSLVDTAATAREGDRTTAPPRLALDTIMELGARQIALVTYDEEREQLLVRVGSTR
jgi:hypothetical protein